MSEPLKSCPFCGSEAKTDVLSGAMVVFCSNVADGNCGLDTWMTAKLWNRRAPSPLPAAVARLIEAMKEFRKYAIGLPPTVLKAMDEIDREMKS